MGDPALQRAIEDRKIRGAHYTPSLLADFVAKNIIAAFGDSAESPSLRILDPAVGDGELLSSLLKALSYKSSKRRLEIYGFDTSRDALSKTALRLQKTYQAEFHLKYEDFLEFTYDNYAGKENSLFSCLSPDPFDIVIANPPYVRTQVMGAQQSQSLARRFGLSGRVDVYHAFIQSIARVLRPGGIAGIIVSNRFMTTLSGVSVRKDIASEFGILHVWDLGDTRLFEAAVLPAVLLLRKKNGVQLSENPKFTSIYSITDNVSGVHCDNVFAALRFDGIVEINRKERYLVRQGKLDYGDDPSNVWRISTAAADEWLSTVAAHTYCTFGDIGKVRVGVKTTADKVFIRSDWNTLPKEQYPELLRPLTTHHIAQRFRALKPADQLRILYTHQVVNGRRTVISLTEFPRMARYLESHRTVLESRTYVLKAGRRWFEIWVPQDPDAWNHPKIVFRDIAETPTFWMDLEGSVVNGDCYWLMGDDPKRVDLLWLALAVGNSLFIEEFYDHRFHNKLYAGRRRFMTQYVEEFPLPAPNDPIGKEIIQTVKKIYRLTPSTEADSLKIELDKMIWQAFGLPIKK